MLSIARAFQAANSVKNIAFLPLEKRASEMETFSLSFWRKKTLKSKQPESCGTRPVGLWNRFIETNKNENDKFTIERGWLLL